MYVCACRSDSSGSCVFENEQSHMNEFKFVQEYLCMCEWKGICVGEHMHVCVYVYGYVPVLLQAYFSVSQYVHVHGHAHNCKRKHTTQACFLHLKHQIAIAAFVV